MVSTGWKRILWMVLALQVQCAYRRRQVEAAADNHSISQVQELEETDALEWVLERLVYKNPEEVEQVEVLEVSWVVVDLLCVVEEWEVTV